MGTALAEIAEVASRRGLTLRRSWPGSESHLLLDLLAGDGSTVAGQWYADPARAAHVAHRTGAGATSTCRVVLQPGGADRRLTDLSTIMAAGATLVVHRQERRAVTRTSDGHWTKLVRPAKAPALLAASTSRPTGIRTATVVGYDLARGSVTTATLPGTALHDLLATAGDEPGHRRLLGAAEATGAALARLHAGVIPAGTAIHDGQAELAVTLRWLSNASSYGLLAVSAPDLSGLLSGGRRAPLHRDLHDKQILVTPAGGVGMLDLDLAAAGEPALDLANLLVHLELRALQGRCSATVAAEAAAAVLSGYAPDDGVRRRLAPYARAARLRLAAVYAFRPAERDVSLALLEGGDVSS